MFIVASMLLKRNGRQVIQRPVWSVVVIVVLEFLSSREDFLDA